MPEKETPLIPTTAPPEPVKAKKSVEVASLTTQWVERKTGHKTTESVYVREGDLLPEAAGFDCAALVAAGLAKPLT